MDTAPAYGGFWPLRTRIRLVLPAPLRPTRPTLSPARTVKLASTNVRRPPTSTARFLAWSTAPVWRVPSPFPRSLRLDAVFLAWFGVDDQRLPVAAGRHVHRAGRAGHGRAVDAA